MLSPELRERLAELTRVWHAAPARAAPPVDLPPPLPVAAGRREAADLASLAALLPGDELSTPAGPHYRVRQPLDAVCRTTAALLTAVVPVPPEGTRPELAALAAALPRDAMFLDLETCGFAGSPIFLVGLIRVDAGQLVVEQLLARDYTEERAVLGSLWRRASQARVLVTFNGKSFDWPMVHDRSTVHGLGRMPRRRRGSAGGRLPAVAATPAGAASLEAANMSPPGPELLGPRDARPEPIHCDLLHHARRRWRRRLRDCRLQTLEAALCRRMRQDDIPGHQIPHEYHAFVRTGDARAIERIAHHNLLDLLTMAAVAARLLHAAAEPEPPRGGS